MFECLQGTCASSLIKEVHHADMHIQVLYAAAPLVLQMCRLTCVNKRTDLQVPTVSEFSGDPLACSHTLWWLHKVPCKQNLHGSTVW